MSYSPSDGVVSAPVAMYDVQRAIGLSSNDLGTLCSSSNINKWAKYKPVITPTIDTVTGQWSSSSNAWSSSATWWKGGNGHCGLTFSTYSGITASFISQLMNGSLQWVYNRPYGTSSSPYRLQDFAQYFHEAVAPVGSLANAGGTIYAQSSGTGKREITLDYDAPAAGGLNLTLADFSHNGTSFTNYYLGVVLYKSSSNYRVVTSTSKIGSSGNTSITCEIGYDDLGTWKVMPFLSSVKITVDGSLPSGTYLSAGYPSADTITIASAGTVFEIFASGTWTSSSYNEVGLNVTVRNNNSSSRTFSRGLTVYIYEANPSDPDGSQGSLVGSWAYNTSFTVPANGTYTIPDNYYRSAVREWFCGFVSGITKNPNKEYWVTARFNDSTTYDNQWDQVQDNIFVG